jgi:hypothetical protein
MIFETPTWEKKMAMLREYKRVHGHLRGLANLNRTLARWTTRVRKNRNSLTPEQAQQLEEVGFTYESQQDRWESHIKDLLDFKNTHGHVGVPRNYVKRNRSLVTWCYFLKSQKLRKLSRERIEELDRLGFKHGRDASTGLLITKPTRGGKGTSKKVWEKSTAALCHSQAETWKRRLQEPLAFKKAENPNVAKWVDAIRGSKTTGMMSAVMMEELDNIGLRHGRDPSTGLAFDSTKNIKQETQNEGSSPQQEVREDVHAPQPFQALDNGHREDSRDNNDSKDGFVSSGVRDGENVGPKVDRKKYLEEDFTKTDQPPREVLSQVRMVDLFDAGPMFKPQDLQHYNSVTLISCQQSTA